MSDIKISASMINVRDKGEKGRYGIEGNADVDKVFSEGDVLEIKVWDSKERPMIISDEHKKKMHENFMRRFTRHALNIRENMKDSREDMSK